MGRVSAPLAETYSDGRGAMWSVPDQIIPTGVATRVSLPSGGSNSMWHGDSYTEEPDGFVPIPYRLDATGPAALFFGPVVIGVHLEFGAAAGAGLLTTELIRVGGAGTLVLATDRRRLAAGDPARVVIAWHEYLVFQAGEPDNDRLWLRVTQTTGADLTLLGGGGEDRTKLAILAAAVPASSRRA